MSNWPPTLILYFFYGCAVLRVWGTRSFLDFITKSTKSQYYDEDTEESGELEEEAEKFKLGHRLVNETTAQQTAACSARLAKRQKREDKPPICDVMDMVLGLGVLTSNKGKR
jgi:hypothetical protein